MKMGDIRFGDDRQIGLMRLVIFGWKSSNDIRPENHIRPTATRLITKAQNITRQVAAFHPFQNQIITML